MLNSSKYMRISLNNQCNLNCYYCHREGNISDEKFFLSAQELKFFCEVALKAGFKKFKLTGGEPTLRSDICEIVEALATLNLPDLSMITNGTKLKELAAPLRKAGLRRLNMTFNTLNDYRFQMIQRKKISFNDTIQKILEGLEEAQRVGFTDIKLNFVYFDDDSKGDLSELINHSQMKNCILVVLPLLQNKNYTLMYLYELIKNFGIVDEKILVDEEGIRKKLIRLANGARVLLRIDELADRTPYNFCVNCTSQSECREGIFPIRLSAQGQIIPCMASNEHRIDVLPLIRARDSVSLRKTFEKINSWYQR